MGIWSKLIGTGNTIEKGMDMAEKAFYTDQENAEHRLKVISAYEPFKIAQRYLMLIVCVPYSFAWFLVFTLSWFMDVSTQKEFLQQDPMVTSFILMVSFYFCGGMIEGGINAYKNRVK